MLMFYILLLNTDHLDKLPWTSSQQELGWVSSRQRAMLSSWGETSPPHSRVMMGGGKTPWSTKPPPTGPSPEQATVHGPPGWSRQQNLRPPGLVGPWSGQQSTGLQAGAGSRSLVLWGSLSRHHLEIPQSFFIIIGNAKMICI